MMTQGEDIRKKRGSSRTKGEAAGLAIYPPLDQGAVARLAYSYWEARGRQNGSPEEDWLNAEAELRDRPAGAATG
jgi:hypothetical protein